MVVKIVGSQRIDFQSQSGDFIKGTKLHFTYVPDNPSARGVLTDSIFIRDGSDVRIPKIEFDTFYEFIYSFNGKRPILTEIRSVVK